MTYLNANSSKLSLPLRSVSSAERRLEAVRLTSAAELPGSQYAANSAHASFASINPEPSVFVASEAVVTEDYQATTYNDNLPTSALSKVARSSLMTSGSNMLVTVAMVVCLGEVLPVPQEARERDAILNRPAVGTVVALHTKHTTHVNHYRKALNCKGDRWNRLNVNTIRVLSHSSIVSPPTTNSQIYACE